VLQFFDDWPQDRWDAFLQVERHVRKCHLSGTPSIESRRRYIQMTLVAAYELKLTIVPEWQSESGLLYRVAGLGLDEDDGFAEFERDLTAVMPKIEMLAKRGNAPRNISHPQLPLDITDG
jgi:hypothetical protein